jgi:hypothetical protein
MEGFFFFLIIKFFLISQNIYKKRRGAQPIVHREYTRESLRGRRETGNEI